MTDVRALLAAERQSRRITHPHLTYSKNGALTCNICSLNIKSEQLWPGHLKSLNHRKNVQRISETTTARPTKRKIESVEEDNERERDHEVDSRKKPRSASQTVQDAATDTMHATAPMLPPSDVTESHSPLELAPEILAKSSVVMDEEEGGHEAAAEGQSNRVDEDEWAAFERDVAVLAQPQNYTSATIEAAPVTTAELAEQRQKNNEVQQREEEAEAEKEDESRRLEEEFEVMEEMEERVKRLRERREALRAGDPTMQQSNSVELDQVDGEKDRQQIQDEGEEDSSEDQIDDWYG